LAYRLRRVTLRGMETTWDCVVVGAGASAHLPSVAGAILGDLMAEAHGLAVAGAA
jgi:hypothetical protein